ncbi:restriction endonuclease [Labrys sp. 22185]|uniref:restriction endonuclease n=1 Tax=Labrys sp. 22185 TaxID=3453888 RepID=UPI003F8561F9
MVLRLLDPPEWIDGGGFLGEGYSSSVPPGHGGPCAVGYTDKSGQHWVVFPSYEQACTAAAGACRWDVGGYTAVNVQPLSAAPVEAPRFETVLHWLFEDLYPPEEDDQLPGVAYIMRDAMRRLIRRIAEDPDELLDMEWRDLERTLYEALFGLGYSVRLTPSSKDGGYDLEVEIEGKRYLVEVKHWSAPSRVGEGTIQRFAEVVLAERAAGGLFLSTSGYTKAAAAVGRCYVTSMPIILAGRQKIMSFCRNFLLSERGIWERDRSLTEVFFEDSCHCLK